MKKRILIMFRLATVVVTLIYGIAAASPVGAARAAPIGCVGASCQGKDPAVTGCDRDARTLARAVAPAPTHRGELYVELRYSPRCRAYWARTIFRGQFDPTIRLTALLGTGAVTRVSTTSRTVWSRMWPGRLTACGTAAAAANPGIVEFASVCAGASR